jgi:tetratricopeptide (TPR) repeat protein
LTYARYLSVRPFATTSKYAAQAVDPVTVGRDLNVTHLLSGEFIREHKNLQITLELIETASDRALWRKTITVDSNDFIAMHKQIEDLVRGEVMAALGAAPSVGEVPAPKNARAFDSYLRSVAVSRDPVPNKLAIKNLEEAVSLDPSYAPAWTELGWRYYIDGHYGEGGQAAMSRGEQANQRAIDLDPYGVTNFVTLKTERGNLKGAYDEANRLLRRRPDASAAHYEMSYVLRYAGLLKEAGDECDRALRIDSGYYLFRSCALAFIFRSDYVRAEDYIRLDESSGVSIKSKLYIALRQKQYSAASILVSKISNAGFPWVELIAAQLAGRPDIELGVIASRQEQSFKVSRDTEDMYETATALSFANQSASAIRILRMAITHGYCSYPAIDSDPLLDSIRKQPEFQELRQQAIACQQEFLAERQKIDADSGAHRQE